MRQIILILNPAKAETLEGLGFSSCGTRDVGDGKVVFQFMLTDELHRALKDKSLFSKKDYCFDTRLTF